jgi:drug/metabolite transporter (DMT)-like permease
MRDQPTLRIPLGVLALLVGLAVYAGVVVWASRWIGAMPVWAQTVVYLVLGIAWLLPLKRFLIWMETGRWKAPSGASDGT